MKKIFVFIVTMVILTALVFSAEYDIRKLNWGMSYDEVLQIEGLKSELYKKEKLLDLDAEVLFGLDSKGLHSVSYQTKETEFAIKARELLKKKYGEPKKALDYSFLIKSKNVLKQYPSQVVHIFDKGDFSVIYNLKSTDSSGGPTGGGADPRKIIKVALSKRSMWEYGNTVVLLLDSPEIIALSYCSKEYHNQNKVKFEAFLKELRKAVKKEKAKTDEGEKF
jgi:hypothetical protein